MKSECLGFSKSHIPQLYYLFPEIIKKGGVYPKCPFRTLPRLLAFRMLSKSNSWI